MDAIISLAPYVLTALAAFAGTIAAVKVELRWLRRDVDAAHARLDRHESHLLTGASD